MLLHRKNVLNDLKYQGLFFMEEVIGKDLYLFLTYHDMVWPEEVRVSGFQRNKRQNKRKSDVVAHNINTLFLS